MSHMSEAFDLMTRTDADRFGLHHASIGYMDVDTIELTPVVYGHEHALSGHWVELRGERVSCQPALALRSVLPSKHPSEITRPWRVDHILGGLLVMGYIHTKAEAVAVAYGFAGLELEGLDWTAARQAMKARVRHAERCQDWIRGEINDGIRNKEGVLVR